MTGCCPISRWPMARWMPISSSTSRSCRCSMRAGREAGADRLWLLDHHRSVFKKLKRGEPLPGRHRRGAERSGQHRPRLAAAAVHGIDRPEARRGQHGGGGRRDAQSQAPEIRACRRRAIGPTFDDVTASVTYPSFARQAGLSEQDCLGFDNNSDSVRRYAIAGSPRPSAPTIRAAEIHRHLSGISRGQGHVAAAVWRPDRLSLVARRGGHPSPNPLADSKAPAWAGARLAGAQCENMIGTVMVFRIEAVAPPMAIP